MLNKHLLIISILSSLSACAINAPIDKTTNDTAKLIGQWQCETPEVDLITILHIRNNHTMSRTMISNYAKYQVDEELSWMVNQNSLTLKSISHPIVKNLGNTDEQSFHLISLLFKQPSREETFSLTFNDENQWSFKDTEGITTTCHRTK